MLSEEEEVWRDPLNLIMYYMYPLDTGVYGQAVKVPVSAQHNIAYIKPQALEYANSTRIGLWSDSSLPSGCTKNVDS